MPITLDAVEKIAAEGKGGSDLKFLFGREEIPLETQLKFFHIGVCSVSKFARFADSSDDLKKVLKDEFELDPATSLRHRTEVAPILCAFTNASARTVKMAEVDAENQPMIYPTFVSTSLMTQIEHM